MMLKPCRFGIDAIRKIADRIRSISGFNPKDDTDFRTVVNKFGGTVTEFDHLDYIHVNG